MAGPDDINMYGLAANRPAAEAKYNGCTYRATDTSTTYLCISGAWEQIVGPAAGSDEAIDDRVAALIVAGANITKTYNDPAGTLTLAAAGAVTAFARVYHSLAQSIATSTPTALNFDSEREDTDTIHDTATNNSRLTCKTAGRYLIYASIQFDQAAAATGRYSVELRLNGATPLARQTAPGTATYPGLSVMTVYPLIVNDYVEVLAFQESGSAKSLLVSSNSSPEFGMYRLGA